MGAEQAGYWQRSEVSMKGRAVDGGEKVLTSDKKPPGCACCPKLILSDTRVAGCIPFGYIGNL